MIYKSVSRMDLSLANKINPRLQEQQSREAGIAIGEEDQKGWNRLDSAPFVVDGSLSP